MKEIPIPGTDATLEIDEEQLAEMHVPKNADLDDLPFADAHCGDNYGKPTLSKGDK